MLAHRLVLAPEAELDRFTAADAVSAALAAVPVAAREPRVRRAVTLTPRTVVALVAIALAALALPGAVVAVRRSRSWPG